MATTPNVTSATVVAPAVVLTPSAKLQKSVTSYLDLSAQVAGKFEALIEQCKEDKTNLKYDQAQCRVVLQAAYRVGFETVGKKHNGLEGDALKAFVESEMKRKGPDISKVLVLTFPKSDEAAIELQKAQEAGLGLNKQMEIARGNTTVEAIKQEAANKAAGAKPETAQNGGAPKTPTTATTTTPQAPMSEASATQKLSPTERLQNNVIALDKWARSIGLDSDAIADIVTGQLAECAAEHAEAAKQASAATPETK
jgi:hypothetical protein